MKIQIIIFIVLIVICSTLAEEWKLRYTYRSSVRSQEKTTRPYPILSTMPSNVEPTASSPANSPASTEPTTTIAEPATTEPTTTTTEPTNGVKTTERSNIPNNIQIDVQNNININTHRNQQRLLRLQPEHTEI